MTAGIGSGFSDEDGAPVTGMMTYTGIARQLCYLWKLFVLSSLCLVGGIERQRTALQRDEQQQEYELVHIAKTAGRNIKYQSKRLGEKSPLSKARYTASRSLRFRPQQDGCGGSARPCG